MALGDPYITGEDLAAYLGITTAGHEAELDLAVNATSRWVDRHCGREFNLGESATARVFDTTNSERLAVPDIGHATIDVATDTTGDGTFASTWAASDFQVEPLDALTAGEPVVALTAVGSYTFPQVVRRRGLVRVTAQWGWPTVPEPVRQATYIQAARLYKRRDSAEGVLGFGDFGPVRVGVRLDPDVEALLERYVLHPVGTA
jgi:hypothetical protein